MIPTRSMMKYASLRAIPDRVAILAVLDDPPKGLAELRAALLSERVWRRSEGIS